MVQAGERTSIGNKWLLNCNLSSRSLCFFSPRSCWRTEKIPRGTRQCQRVTNLRGRCYFKTLHDGNTKESLYNEGESCNEFQVDFWVSDAAFDVVVEEKNVYTSFAIEVLKLSRLVLLEISCVQKPQNPRHRKLRHSQGQ